MTSFMNEFGIILYATLIYTPPLLYAALGSCFSDDEKIIPSTPCFGINSNMLINENKLLR